MDSLQDKTGQNVPFYSIVSVPWFCRSIPSLLICPKLTSGDRDMTEDEWLEGLRGLPDDVILKIHFDLQEKIKKHYKLRDTGKNLEKAIHYCQQQIALAPLAMSAMKKNPGMYDNGQFFAPGHHGYRQYATILKKQKDTAGLDALLKKKKAEGWAD